MFVQNVDVFKLYLMSDNFILELNSINEYKEVCFYYTFVLSTPYYMIEYILNS